MNKLLEHDFGNRDRITLLIFTLARIFCLFELGVSYIQLKNLCVIYNISGFRCSDKAVLLALLVAVVEFGHFLIDEYREFNKKT